jgi:predicted component of type VI protein secretion system
MAGKILMHILPISRRSENKIARTPSSREIKDWDLKKSLDRDLQTILDDRILELSQKPKRNEIVDRYIAHYEECGGGAAW